MNQEIIPVVLEAGSTAFDTFEILDRIGSGGMGAIYRARHIHMDREVVLKVLDNESDKPADAVRFQREAKLLSRLDHPNIAQVYDFGVSSETPYIAIEFVDGQSLDRIIKKRGPFSFEEALPILLQLTEALSHAHRLGIFHRDLKPANVMVEEKDSGTRVVLVDFGIAKLAEHLEISGQNLTGSGKIVGTPTYMSPEQCSGGEVTDRTDQYSFGCLMFAMISGKPPIRGDSALITISLQTKQVPPLLSEKAPSPVAPQVDRLVSRLLAKNPDDRFESMKELEKNLLEVEETVSEEKEFDTESKEPPPQAVPSLNRKWIAALIVLTVSLIALPLLVGKVSEKERLPSVKDHSLGKDSFVFSLGDPAAEIVAKRVVEQGGWRADFGEGTATPEALKLLGKHRKLRRIKLKASTITDSQLNCLKDLNLLDIDVSNTDVTTLDTISQIKSLQNLNLQHNVLKEGELRKLKRLPMLKDLRLRGAKVSLSDLRALAGFQALAFLTLPANLEEETVRFLSRSLPMCKIVGYQYTPYLDPERSLRKENARHFNKVKRVYEDCIEKASQIQGRDSIAAAHFHAGLGLLCHHAGRLAEDRKHLQAAISICRRTGYDVLLAGLLARESNYLAAEGKAEEALEASKRAWELSSMTCFPDNLELPNRRYALAFRYASAKDSERAESIVKEALDMASKRLDIRIGQAEAATLIGQMNEMRLFLGRRYELKGDMRKARRQFNRILRVSANRGDAKSAICGQAIIRIANTMGDEPTGQIEYLKRGIDLLDQQVALDLGEKLDYMDATYQTAILAKQLARKTEAEQYIEKAIVVAKGLRDPERSRKRLELYRAFARQLKTPGGD